MRFLQRIMEVVSQQMEGISVIGWGISTICGFFLVKMICSYYISKSGETIKKSKRVCSYLTVIYLCFLFQITFCNRDAGSRNGVQLFEEFFRRGGRIGIYDALNIALFIPFGLFLFFLFDNKRRLSRLVIVFCISYLLSMIVELCQVVTARGYFEIVDLVMNTMGGVIGSGMALCLSYSVKEKL